MSSNNTWELLKIKAVEVGKTVSGVACEVVDASKLKVEQIKMQRELAAAYAKLGKLCYAHFHESDKIPEEAKNDVKRIEDLEERLAELKSEPGQPDDSEAAEACPYCGGMNRTSASYCSYCGKKIDENAD